MNTAGQTIALPAGYAIGDRIVTNDIYARITPRRPGPYEGTITGGSRGADGPVKIQLDTMKNPRALALNLFHVVRK